MYLTPHLIDIHFVCCSKHFAKNCIKFKATKYAFIQILMFIIYPHQGLKRSNICLFELP